MFIESITRSFTIFPFFSGGGEYTVYIGLLYINIFRVRDTNIIKKRVRSSEWDHIMVSVIVSVTIFEVYYFSIFIVPI